MESKSTLPGVAEPEAAAGDGQTADERDCNTEFQFNDIHVLNSEEASSERRPTPHPEVDGETSWEGVEVTGVPAPELFEIADGNDHRVPEPPRVPQSSNQKWTMIMMSLKMFKHDRWNMTIPVMC